MRRRGIPDLTNDPSRAHPAGARAITIHHGDNLPLLRTMEDERFDLIYIDPPFNTGHTQTRTTQRNVRDPEGDRTGFKGQLVTPSKRAAFDSSFLVSAKARRTRA